MRRSISAESTRNIFTRREQTGSIGGTWVFTEEMGKDSNGIPILSSMYYNLGSVQLFSS